MRLLPRQVLHALVAVALYAPYASAQAWRTVDATRQRQGAADSVLHVRVDYGAGEISLAAARPQLLYDVQLRYDADRFAPTRRFDPAARTLSIGLNSEDTGRLALVRHGLTTSGTDGGPSASNKLALALARDLPLDLLLNLGAVEAQLDLSNLWMDRLVLRSGASDVKLTFGTPNPRRMRLLEILGGATSISIADLGNANTSALRVRTGAASVELDFGGAWTGDMQVDLTAALGDATLRVPADVGVQVTMRKLLADLDGSALHFTKRNGAYYSANWDDAPHKLTIDARTVLGDVTVTRLPR